ncbi:hypothetical protein LZZ85_01525 [Terrimonas sp. NA20]|uniref:Uncharacterized protein n=1 Tax=Terrimonas ginsenosidimutans TaxID=2908004 RepID=A0ABS9KKT1_9BACT|nr:hypothetical protein [Terrimonas ginsenosidimutans]MCG2612931.1 hypothetical protein [Terrimonas ginsenosidimutans]
MRDIALMQYSSRSYTFGNIAVSLRDEIALTYKLNKRRSIAKCAMFIVTHPVFCCGQGIPSTPTIRITDRFQA